MKLSTFARTKVPNGRVDTGLLVGFVTLALLGDLMIFSATRTALVHAGYDPLYYLKRQTMWVVIGFVLMTLVSRIDFRRFEIVATPFYIASVVGVGGVMFFGSEALGAQRWYDFGFVQIQPSEFAVLGLILAAATYAARRPEGLVKRDVMRLIMMSLLPMIIIAVQPDLGTAIIMTVIVSVMVIVAGVPPRMMAVMGFLGVIVAALSIYFGYLKPYQVARLISFLNQNSNDENIAALIYHVDNAKNAIGAGGLFGSGLFNGLQTTLGYVPEQRTDFIFTAIGEQLGLIGTLSVLGLIAFVAYRLFVVSRDAKDQFGRLVVAGIFVFFAYSSFQNIGMTMGIMPVTGIPLPLLSYGGTAAIVFSIAAGAALSVSRRRGS
jgi:rod shape determining protein RodA